MDQKHMLITAALCVIFFATGVLVGMRTGPRAVAQDPAASPPANYPVPIIPGSTGPTQPQIIIPGSTPTQPLIINPGSTSLTQRQMIIQEIKIVQRTLKQQGTTLSELTLLHKQLYMTKKTTGSNEFDSQIQRLTSEINTLTSSIESNMMRLQLLEGKLAKMPPDNDEPDVFPLAPNPGH